MALVREDVVVVFVVFGGDAGEDFDFDVAVLAAFFCRAFSSSSAAGGRDDARFRFGGISSLSFVVV